MVKRLVAIFGIVFVLAGLSLGGYLQSSANQAEALDSQFSQESSNPCASPLPSIELPNRAMGEQESQALRVHLSNAGSGVCTVDVTIQAPNFDISPSQATRRIDVPPGSETAELVWVISPRRIGTFQIAVESGVDTDIVGITVVTALGLSAQQMQILSVISTAFGPILTVPWWLEQLQKRKSKRRR